MSPSRSSTSDAKTSARVRDYLASMPANTRKALRTIRATIKATAPGAVEHFSYGIPGFKLEGQPLVWYAGFGKHTSLYPIGAAIRRAHAAHLEGYEMSTGTVRFPLSEPVPTALVRRLVKARIAEVRKKSRDGR